jgi:hypothetical protein
MGRLTVLEALAVPFRTCYRARGGARLRAASSANGFRALDRTPAARAPVHAPVRADPNGHTVEGPARSGRGRGRSSARRRCAVPSCPGRREDEDPGTRKTARPALPLPPRRRGPCALGDESGSLWHLRREIAKTATPIRGEPVRRRRALKDLIRQRGPRERTVPGTETIKEIAGAQYVDL